MIVALVLPVIWLILVGMVHGSCSGNLNISSPEEAAAISSCTTFSGRITIQPPAPTIALEGIQELTQDLIIADNPHLENLASSTLRKISGLLYLLDVQNITTVNFPKLHAVDRVDLQNTPGLRDIIFDQSLNVSRFSISGNLSVQNLGLTLKSADFLALYDVNLKSLSSSISTLRSLWVQDRPPELLDFPNLTSLGNLSCWRCLSLSMPVLAAVNDTIIFRYPGINKLELPNLNTVNGSLEFWNTSISTLSLPALQSVGNINLSKNPNLTSIALERLTTVGWNLDFSGTFGNVTIPNLQSVAQNFSIATTNESMSCGVFDAYKDRGIIKGSYQCKGTHPNPSRPTPTSTGLPSSTRSKTPTALSVGQKAGIGVAVPLAVLALTSASIFVLRRKRKQSKDVSSAQDDWAKPEKDGKEISWHELADGLPREMESGKEAHELQAEHGHSEAGIASGVRVIEGTHELGT